MGRRAVKKYLIVGIAYLLCFVALSATFLFSLSTGKYFSRINAYTDFEIGDFKGMIYYLLKQENDEDLLKKFGYDDHLLISGCVPGMKSRTYPFVIANGNSNGNYAGSDIVCSIKIRTMGNIPLKYQLRYNGTVYDSSAEPEQIVKKDKYSKIEDAVWFEYSFYEVTPGENGVADTVSETEAVFELDGGNLSADPFDLVISWPITGSGSGDETNDTKYMKEVEILEVVATLTSKNKTEESSGSGDDESLTYGVIFLDPAHSESKTIGDATVYAQKYVGDYRALTLFKEEKDIDGETVISRGYEYCFNVNNGNNIYKDGVLVSSQTTAYMYYTIKLATPYETKTKDISFALEQKTTDKNNPIMYSVLSTEYRKYDVFYDSPNYGTYSVITQAEADDYIAKQNDPNQAEPPFYEIYRIDSFYQQSDTAEAVQCEAVQRLENKTVNTVPHVGYSENNYRLLVIDDAASNALKHLLDDSHAQEPDANGNHIYKNPVDYKFELWISAIESEYPEAPEAIPDAYSSSAPSNTPSDPPDPDGSNS